MFLFTKTKSRNFLFIFFLILLFGNELHAQKFRILNNSIGVKKCSNDTLVLRTNKNASYSNYKWFDEFSSSNILSNKDTFAVFSFPVGAINIVASVDSASVTLYDTITVSTLKSPNVNLIHFIIGSHGAGLAIILIRLFGYVSNNIRPNILFGYAFIVRNILYCLDDELYTENPLIQYFDKDCTDR